MEYRCKVTVIDKKLYPELQAEYCKEVPSISRFADPFTDPQRNIFNEISLVHDSDSGDEGLLIEARHNEDHIRIVRTESGE